MVNLTPKAVSVHIMYDGGRMTKAVNALRKGHTRMDMVKVFGEKTVSRAVRLKDKMDQKMAHVSKKTPEALELISNGKLTEKGVYEAMLYEKHSYAGMVDDVAAEYVARFINAMLNNVPLWVRYDRLSIEGDKGMDLWKTLMPLVQRDDYMGCIKAGITFLLRERRKDGATDMTNAMNELLAKAQDPTRVVFDHDKFTLEILSDLESMEENVDDDEEIRDLPEASRGKDEVTNEIIAIGQVSTFADEKRDASILRLLNARHEKMNTAQLYESVLRPLIDQYSGKACFGSGNDMVTVTPTERDAEIERDDFPYQDTVFKEYWYKQMPVKMTDLGHDERGRWKGRQITEVRQVRVKEYNLDTKGEFEVDHCHARVEDYRDWRKSVGMAQLDSSAGKANLERFGYKKVVDDHFKILIEARYLRICEENQEEPTDQGLKQMTSRCMHYYAW
jgi:hypothetical protein